MKILRRIFLILGLSAVIVCSWMASMDSRATAQVDASLKRALVSFASARAIGGLLSVVQATQVDIQPAGIGATLSPGQMLAPVNELVKHFADLMLMACIALGIERTLISIGGYWLVSVALTLVGIGWAAFKFRRDSVPTWLSKTFVLLLMVRFAIPVAVLGTNELAQKFLKADYTAAQAAIEAVTVKAGKEEKLEPPAVDAKRWILKMPDWVPSMPEVRAQYSKMTKAVEQSTEHIIKLIVIFLLETLLLPLLIIRIVYGVTKGMLDRPKFVPEQGR